MIGRLRGTLLVRQPPQLLIDINGVGYEVEAPMSTFYQLPEAGVEVTLHTHMVVREDAQLLYGFVQEDERRMFRALIKVNGVGPKLGLTILSGISAEEFIQTIVNGDAKALTRLPGVGKKTAERLIVEMRDVLEKWHVDGDSTVSPSLAALAPVHDPVEDAVSALIALGYKPADASRMVNSVDSNDLASDEIIRQALQGAAK